MNENSGALTSSYSTSNPGSSENSGDCIAYLVVIPDESNLLHTEVIVGWVLGTICEKADIAKSYTVFQYIIAGLGDPDEVDSLLILNS